MRATAVRRGLASIRLRVVAGYVALLAVALAVAVLVTRQVQVARLDRDISRELAQEVEELRVLADEGIDPRHGAAAGRRRRADLRHLPRAQRPERQRGLLHDRGGAPYRRSFNAPAALFDDEELLATWTSARAPTTGAFDTEVGETRFLAVPMTTNADSDPAGVFVVAFFPDADQAEIAQVIRVAAITGLSALAVSSLIAWSLAGRVLRPVRQLTQTARQISGSDLTARIPVDGHDELAELGATFNEMVSRLDEGFRAQRRFLDDVAHELRTPITIARGHLEVLGDDPDERAETVAIVTDELDRMSRYVTDLLILAKAEQPEFLAVRPVDLGELATGALQRVKALAPRRWVLDQAPPVGTVATLADPDRLEQALVNLAAERGAAHERRRRDRRRCRRRR